MTTTTFKTALKRMQSACSRSEGSGRPYIESCAEVAEQMVAEVLENVDGGVLEPQFRAILVAFGEQTRKHGGPETPGSTMPNGTNDARYRVLGEEVGEVANALNEAALVLTDGAFKKDIMGKPARDWEFELRKELTDVATVAVAWLYWLEVNDAGRAGDEGR